MGGYNTGDLHHRQHSGTAGHAVLASVNPEGRRWRPLRVPVAVTLLGLLLAMWGPLPGLGMFLVMGGVMGLATTAGLALLGGFS